MAPAENLVLIILSFCGLSECVFKLKALDRYFLPFQRYPDLYGYNNEAITAFAYHLASNNIYVTGHSYIHILSGLDPYFLEHRYNVSVPGFELTDVESCGDYVIVAAENLVDPEDGRVFVYGTYNHFTRKMPLLHNISVGSLPDMILPTKDCRTIVACIEAEPYTKDGQFIDPVGGVTIIRFISADLSGPYRLKKLDFSAFDAEEYERRGVRFIYKENGNSFTRDMEPEYVTFNADETVAYVVLQENNAIATVDISNFDTAKITEIYPLGYVDWQKSKLDASDKDGVINQLNWGIWGMYQPDTIKYFQVDGKAYILTVNEGDAKDYSSWSEEMRGQKFVEGDLVGDNKNNSFKDALSVVSGLGRLKFSTASGRNSTTNKFNDFYAFGSRSFTIRSAEDMSIVYDSQDSLETAHIPHLRILFNANVNSGSSTVNGTFDQRSDDKGPEPESGAVGTIKTDTVFFIGNERTGTIAIYTVRHDLQQPVLQSLNYGGNLTSSDTWEHQYAVRRIGDMDPEDMLFISARDSPILGQDLLVVSGAVSGTLTIYAVVDEEGSGPVTPDPCEVGIRRLFDMADNNTDEFVPPSEFIFFIVTSADLGDPGDGFVTKDEFIYNWEGAKGVNLNEDGKDRVFNALDMNNNGLIDSVDCLNFLGIMDVDGSKQLTIDEWRREWRKVTSHSMTSSVLGAHSPWASYIGESSFKNVLVKQNCPMRCV